MEEEEKCLTLMMNYLKIFQEYMDNAFTERRALTSFFTGVFLAIASISMEMLADFQYYFTTAGWSEYLGKPFAFIYFDHRPGFKYPFGLHWQMVMPWDYGFFLLDAAVWGVIIYIISKAWHIYRGD